MDIRRLCSTCHGTGEVVDQVGGTKPCHVCGGATYTVIGSVDSIDLEDKVNDILDKCNDIMEKLNE